MKLVNDDDAYVAHCEGGEEDGNEQEEKKSSCFHNGTEWMKIKEGDMEVLQKLLMLEHPLQ